MNRPLRIGINGFGRIGRAVYKIAQNFREIEIVHVNDLASPETLCHLVKYDSVHGKFNSAIQLEDNCLISNSVRTSLSNFKNPESIPWKELNVDAVIECSGHFLNQSAANAHLTAGAKRVLLSAPPKDDGIKTIVMGVNQHLLNPQDSVISNASCTTNCAAPMLYLLNRFGIEEAYVTTVHSYTNDQRLHDGPHSDLRRARAAALSIIPTSTGAAKALTLIFPEFIGRIGGCGMRVPVPDGSLTDITCVLKNSPSREEINLAFKTAALGSLKGIVGYTEDPIVGVDVIGNSNSVLFDSEFTSVVGNLVKVIGWYDNEWGYSHRLIDVLKYWLLL